MKLNQRLIAFCIMLLVGQSCKQADKQPNVVIIFADDLGYNDIGCFGAIGYQTPALDQMAKEGMTFTDFCVAAYVCSPSRGALLTGRYPQRFPFSGVFFPWSENGLPSSELTIAEVLKEQGYTTACVGKWHLGHKPEFLPLSQGFDSYFGIPYSNDMSQDGAMPLAEDAKIMAPWTLDDYLNHKGDSIRKNYKKYKNHVPLMRNNKVIEWPVDQQYLTQRYTNEAVKIIKENKDRPFFLYLAHSMPHIPIFASPKFKGTTERGLYGDVISELDWSVGEVLKTLKEEGLDENTLVVFTSDNGPWLTMGANGGSADPLRDGKGSSYEGGQRVPCIMWWPKTIPANKVCEEFASTIDLFPTVSKLAGAEVPQDLTVDGLDIQPLMLGEKGAKTPHDYFIYGNNEAIRVGNFKYRSGTYHGKWQKKSIREAEGIEKSKEKVEQLFNLKEDVGEKDNIARGNSEKMEELKKRLNQEKKNF